MTALEFLASANTSDQRQSAVDLVRDQHVVIVGGGSVAMDAAATSAQFGASAVTVVAREGLDALPADADEIAMAREHCVDFRARSQLRSIRETSVEVESVQLQDDGTFAPIPESQGSIPAGVVIMAIGQTFDAKGDTVLSGSGVLRDETTGWVVVNRSTQSTSLPRVYAGGDASRGGDMVVTAVADGKTAAAAIAAENAVPERPQLDLSIDFCGVRFPNPFCLSSSPVSNTKEMCAAAFDAGFGGVYYKTLNLDDKFTISHPSPRLGSVDHAGVRAAVGIQVSCCGK